MKNIRLDLLIIIFIIFLFIPEITLAQPDAGSIIQDQRQPVPQLPDRLPEEEKEEVVKPPFDDTGVKVLVSGFRFTGHYEKITTEEELQKLVKESIGKELGFVQLQHLAEKITNYLRDEKDLLLARAYLPQQDVSEGIIEIAIISGRLDGKADIIIQSPARIRPSVLQGLADRAVPDGTPARTEAFERALLLINDLPGIKAQASLEPGKSPGTTHLVINADEERIFHAVTSIDNYGDRYTGALRGTGQGFAYNPFGLGDQINIYATFSENMIMGKAGYSIPVGSSGATTSASYTHLSYEIGKELKALNSEGKADTFIASLSYPLIRSRRTSVYASLGGEYMMLEDEASGIKTGDRKITVGNLNLNGSFFDSFGGGGLFSTGISIAAGEVDLSGLTGNKIADAAGPKTDGNFARITYSLARLQRITGTFSLAVSIRGQIASGNLDSSQKFTLGGPSGIRAYPVGESSGAEGHIFTIEGRLDLPYMLLKGQTQLIGFIDTGRIKLHKDIWPGAITNITGKNSYSLSGAGIGLNIVRSEKYSIKSAYAHRLGKNSGRSFSGMNSDNRSNEGRLWIQGVLWF